MKIEHLAIWVADLEATRRFYETYFGAQSNDRYHNPRKQFSSYFLSFTDGCRLELMHRPDIQALSDKAGQEYRGIIHFAVSVGSEAKVDALTERLRADGYTVIGEPRRTGDGYYESVVLDPESNRIEITV
ncbi:VOC family protein [Flavilitoribacter nigricans]|uniref:Glyoxalase n=1 Tax=Flavilitoribacter nigricans (strain ATCC 23147 / DSM 23189 / NBRC 102662 / NCIMB 1420 / SS-2) TaxID=1122177 RepID=A0A2D0N930_FLAN2|nr:VOC family protein [Flavilitoribacter nigricans]PHN04987.1 glyoxalase [Flavilitoribacter nigricans DSM 23189 = NBRC 102662]